MINSQRLEKYITSRESMNTTDYLLSFYDSLTVEQRSEIKKMFENNANSSNPRV